MIFVDGFDHYTLGPQQGRKWDLGSNIPTVNGGRNDSGHQRLGYLGLLRKHFASTNHVILQYGVKVAYEGAFYNLCKLESPTGGAHNVLMLLFDGSLQYRRGGVSGTILATSPGGTMSGIVWHYLEIEQTLSTTVGTCVVKLNGDIIFNLTGLNNNASATENPTMMTINGPDTSGGGTAFLYVDDLVLVTGSEAAPFNTLFGDWAVRTLYTNGAGASTQFTPFPVVANYLNVDDTTPDDDTTYVESATVGQRDLYAMTNLPATVISVLGVCTTPTIRKNDAGTRQFANVVHRAGTSLIGVTLTCTSAYAAGLQTMFRFDPITGIAWTPAQVDACEAGYDVVT